MGMICRNKFNGEGPASFGKRTYYKKKAKKGPSPAEQAAAQAAEMQRRVQNATNLADETFAPMLSDEFLGGREQAYLDYYRPEFDRQQKASRDKLMSSLAARNLLASSQGATEQSDFAKSADDAWQNILKGAKDYVTNLRGGLNSARNQVISGGTYSTDAAIRKAAADSSAAFSQAPTFGPVGQLFANATTPVSMAAVYQNQQGGGAGERTEGTVGIKKPFGKSNMTVG